MRKHETAIRLCVLGVLSLILVNVLLAQALTPILALALPGVWASLASTFLALGVMLWLALGLADGLLTYARGEPPEKGWVRTTVLEMFRTMRGKDEPP